MAPTPPPNPGFGQLASSNYLPASADVNTYSGYFSIVSWSVVLLLLFVVARTRIGYYLFFMFVVISIIVVLAAGSSSLVNIMKAGGGIVTPKPILPGQAPSPYQSINPGQFSVATQIT
jgi:hypothetical protein